MLSKSIAIKALNICLSTGADYAEIYYEETLGESITAENGKIDVSTSTINSGVGIRLLKELRSVYGSTNDISKKGVLSLADSLSKSFNDKRLVEVKELTKVKVKQRNDFSKPNLHVDKAKKAEMVLKASNVMAEYDKRIVRTMSSFASSIKKIAIYNSKGKLITDERQYGRIFFVAIAMDNGQIEQAYEGPGCQRSFDYFENMDIEQIAKNTAEVAIRNVTAKECPSGKMPVVIGNGWGGVLFHEACGHSLEATAVAKGLSVFSNSLGKKIASDVVTAIDDATIANSWGSINVDDEGNLGEKTVLIKDGVLKDYLIDDFNGRRMNRKGNGSARRQNYTYEPTSRMTNTYIANGESNPEDIIKATKLGLYAKAFAGGSVNPTTGEFNFACSEAYIIRDGKIAEPVKGATLIGTGEEVLKNIDMVGNDLALGEGNCGSVSGMIPVCVGQPTLRIKEITVGGRGGKLE